MSDFKQVLLKECSEIWGEVFLGNERAKESLDLCKKLLFINTVDYDSATLAWKGTASVWASFGERCQQLNIGDLKRTYVESGMNSPSILACSEENIDYPNYIVSLNLEFLVQDAQKKEENKGDIKESVFIFNITN